MLASEAIIATYLDLHKLCFS